MVGWHYQLSGHEFEQAPEVGDGQGNLACCHGVAKSWTQLSDIGRIDVEADTPVLWPPDAKS